ncbi:maleylpyruvate isomerase N-terminal domain-containing protein [Streptomyces sp. NPDC059082]|uniref:maleylpyruvate isomerase N-terminal domain-containing protein n=1 Tax=Streptomyces sp. NPDC059082 TaxID=3346720 RepID=UPI00367744A0
MTITEHIDALEAAGRGLADAAAQAGPDAEVPTCPGWRVRDLLRHTAMVHRWATTLVAEARTSYHPGDGETTLDGEELLAHFREGHARLVATLRAAPESLECWTFLPAPSPLAFWARRQAHETTVHRADAESALGGGPGPVNPAVAGGGGVRLGGGVHCRRAGPVGGEGARAGRERRGAPAAGGEDGPGGCPPGVRGGVRPVGPAPLRLRATDTGDVWTVRLTPAEPPRTERGARGPADTELSGPADRLYLTLWNRLPADAVTVSGDPDLARLWRETSAIT